MINAESLSVSPLGGSADDIQAVRHLFQEVFGHPISEEAWHWKYLAAPGGVAANFVARESRPGAQPMGHVGCVVLPGTLNGEPALMAHLTDVMVHPSVRAGMSRSSVYGRLMQVMAAQLKAIERNRSQPLFAYGFPGRTPSRLGQRMGLYRPLLPNPHQTAWTHHLQPHLPLGHASITARAMRLSQPPEWQPMIGPTLRKDAAYLRWRYADHPYRTYRLWVLATHWGARVGWVVTSHGQQSWVVDTSLAPERPRTPTWADMLLALGAATGYRSWRSWRPASQCGIDESSEPTLIVPCQFRVDDILAGSRIPCQSPLIHEDDGHMALQPGDTDVF